MAELVRLKDSDQLWALFVWNQFKYKIYANHIYKNSLEKSRRLRCIQHACDKKYNVGYYIWCNNHWRNNKHIFSTVLWIDIWRWIHSFWVINKTSVWKQVHKYRTVWIHKRSMCCKPLVKCSKMVWIQMQHVRTRVTINPELNVLYIVSHFVAGYRRPQYRVETQTPKWSDLG